jgi:hypothetical protein
MVSWGFGDFLATNSMLANGVPALIGATLTENPRDSMRPAH